MTLIKDDMKGNLGKAVGSHKKNIPVSDVLACAALPFVQALVVMGLCIEKMLGGGLLDLDRWLVWSWYWVSDVLEGDPAGDREGSVSSAVGGWAVWWRGGGTGLGRARDCRRRDRGLYCLS